MNIRKQAEAIAINAIGAMHKATISDGERMTVDLAATAIGQLVESALATATAENAVLRNNIRTALMLLRSVDGHGKDAPLTGEADSVLNDALIFSNPRAAAVVAVVQAAVKLDDAQSAEDDGAKGSGQ